MTTIAHPIAAGSTQAEQSQAEPESTQALPTDVLPSDQPPREDGPDTAFPAPPATPASPTAPEPGPAPIQEHTERYRNFSIASFVLGIVSVVAGWTFFAPVTGLVLGIIALRRGTPERTLTIWGVVLNAVMVGVFVLAAMLFAMFALAGLIALPFAV